ncbi:MULTISPECIES: serine O-acetyltransferase [Peribacillus]|uniref:serine O-acetyltransferase n=1 Tax=Peribacillus TaxID=2675229 RepID=UPI001F4ED5CB|nr:MULTISPECIES: serine acetyltransferase [unclassified Peribacillus]MCK1981941.1 serine acetyltransferase [Peribacillus sp. Aquil_B1]MCK2010015.1 serine acetyltransferase [Peribacillus sp. Aquil_B8]
MNLGSLKKLIIEDYYSRYKKDFSIVNFTKAYLLDLNFRVVTRYRIQTYLSTKNKLCFILAVLLRNGNMSKYGVEIGINTKIKGGFNIHHINGIVIGEEVCIGENFNIFQQVTIGKKDIKYPIIGDNVKIYPGVKVIGDIKVGNNVIIGTNSVVNKDIATGAVVAGIPAKVIEHKRSVIYE